MNVPASLTQLVKTMYNNIYKIWGSIPDTTQKKFKMKKNTLKAHMGKKKKKHINPHLKSTINIVFTTKKQLWTPCI
jgi:hypothetical protein